MSDTGSNPRTSVKKRTERSMSDTVIPTESTARTSALPGQAGADLERVRHDDPLVPARADGPDVRTVLMRMVAAGLRAGSSGTRPDVKRPVSLTVARANGTCRQSG